jgi:hypothetical protein
MSAYLQKGQASNSKSCSVWAGSWLRAVAPGPTVVPKGSLDIDAKPEVATSAHRALGAAASPPAEVSKAISPAPVGSYRAEHNEECTTCQSPETSFNSGQKIDRTPDPAPPGWCC